MRVVILGNSGSGKTTMARALQAEHGLAHFDLDAVAWSEAGVRRPLAESVAEVEAFAQACDAWVIEGSYATLAEAALASATDLWFLNPGVEACLANARRRAWEPEKYATLGDQDARLPFLVDWIRSYPTRGDEYGLTAHRAVFDAFRGEKRAVTAVTERGRRADRDGRSSR